MTEKDTVSLVRKAKVFNRQKHLLFGPNEEDNNQKLYHYSIYPHLFVLSCLMDKQVSAKIAWDIPISVCRHLNAWSINALNDYSIDQYVNMFNSNSMHSLNNEMAEVFKQGLSKIVNEYQGDASLVWRGKPSSATVISRFLSFKGCGIKIATMAANLLYRGLDIQFSDYSSIDISPDIHIVRVMSRLGLLINTNNDKKRLEAIYRAREINPSYPGLLDGYFWFIGSNYCKAQRPDCESCPLNDICKRQ